MKDHKKKAAVKNRNVKTALREATMSLPPSLDSLSETMGSLAGTFAGTLQSKRNKKKAVKHSHNEATSTLDSLSLAETSLETIHSETVFTNISHHTQNQNGHWIQEIIDTARRYTPSRRKRRKLFKTYVPGALLLIALITAHYFIQESLRSPEQILFRRRSKLSGTDIMTLNAFMETSMLRSGSQDLPTNGMRYSIDSEKKKPQSDIKQQNKKMLNEIRTEKQTKEAIQKEKNDEALKETKNSKISLVDAVMKKDFRKATILLEKGNDPNKEDPQTGRTPFIEAILNKDKSMVILLMRNGAKSQPPPGFHHTPLRAAALTGNHQLVQLLIKTGADPNAKSKGGRTPLMGACYLRPDVDDNDVSLRVVEILLGDPRTNPLYRNDNNETALDLCEKRKYDQSVKLLKASITKAKRQESPLFS